MQIRKGVNGEVVFDTNSVAQALVIGTTDGEVRVSISSANNELFPQVSGLVYDIRLVDTLGSAKRFIKGAVTVDPAVTKGA